MPAGLVEIADTRLFVDDRGEPGAPPLLFIHGGPGQGCYDFMHAQGDLLARSLRVIAVDQRGVLRSDPLPAEPPLTRELLVSDFEALRARLGIAAWAVLGHSAGGGYALRYVTSHPQAVQSVIFDCPGWDADLTERYRLPEIARRLEDLGQLADAERCRELAARPGRLSVADGTRQAAQALGPHFMDQFFADPDGAAGFAQLLEDSGLTEEQWERGNSHRPLSAALYDPVLPLLPEVRCPAVLIRGKADLVTTPEMVAAFTAAVPGGEVTTFERSGHFAYQEEPDVYCQVVTDFVLAHAG